MTCEIWRDIAGYEGCYQVSNIGRVRSLDRYVFTVGNPNKKRRIHGKILNLSRRMSNGEPGYLYVNLSKNGDDKLYTVHRLVAEAFIPNPDNLPCINHKDEDKSNNRVSNLEWCTIKYNNNYGTARKRSSIKMMRAVLKFDLDGNIIKRYDSLSIAAKEENIEKGNIANVCVGRNGKLTLNNYIFMYEEDYMKNGFVGYKNPRAKQVNQYDLDGNFIRTFDSVALAYESTGNKTVNGAANITAVCKGRQKSAYGYKWIYADDDK